MISNECIVYVRIEKIDLHRNKVPSKLQRACLCRKDNVHGTEQNLDRLTARPLDFGTASSTACWQGKKDIGRSRKKKEKKGKKEEEDEDEDLLKGEMMVEE